jgi:hypothetical protein
VSKGRQSAEIAATNRRKIGRQIDACSAEGEKVGVGVGQEEDVGAV